MTIYKLNTIPKHGYSPTVVHLNEGEYDFTIGFQLDDGDSYFAGAGWDITLNIYKADGNVYSALIGEPGSETGYDTSEMEDGYFEVTIAEQMTSAPGKGVAEFVFTTGGGNRRTANIVWDVERSPLDMDGIESDSCVPYFEQQIAAAEEAAQAAAGSASDADDSADRAASAATSANTYAGRAEAAAESVEQYPRYAEAVRKIINSDDITVIPTFSGTGGTTPMTATTSEYVLVEHDDNTIGSGGPCLYRCYEGCGYISGSDINQGWLRSDGTYVFPVPDQGPLTANEVPLDDIFSVIASYVGNSAVQYTGNGYGTLYSETCTGNIDCSSFVCAVLQGIPYANSRYSLSENIIGDYVGPHYFPTIPVQSGRTHSLKVCKLAEWFAAHKQLFTIPSVRSVDILRPGDVIFSKIDGMSANASKAFYGMGHVAIVVKTYPRDGYALVAQSGGFTDSASPLHGYNIYSAQDLEDTGCRMTIIDVQKLVDIGYMKVFARPAYGRGKTQGKNITGNFFSGNSSGTNTKITEASETMQIIGYIVPKEPLKANTMYTLEIGGGNLPSYRDNGSFFLVRAYDPNGGGTAGDRNRMSYVSRKDHALSFSFVTESSVTAGSYLQLLVIPKYFPGSFTGGAEGMEISITSAALIEGAPCDTHRMRRLAITAGNNITLANRSYRMDGKCFVDIVADISSASAGDIVVGTFGSGFPGTRVKTYMIGFNGNQVVPVEITAAGVVKATVSTKDGNILRILGDFPGRATGS